MSAPGCYSDIPLRLYVIYALSCAEYMLRNKGKTKEYDTLFVILSNIIAYGLIIQSNYSIER